jgi:peptidoglycan hydrolase CwlO-like protein
MVDLGVVGLVVSGIVALFQIFTFFDGRTIRKEQNLNTYAKSDKIKADLEVIQRSTDSKINNMSKSLVEAERQLTDLSELINMSATEIAVIKERITNDKESIKKLDEKLDNILDKI